MREKASGKEPLPLSDLIYNYKKISDSRLLKERYSFRNKCIPGSRPMCLSIFFSLMFMFILLGLNF